MCVCENLAPVTVMGSMCVHIMTHRAMNNSVAFISIVTAAGNGHCLQSQDAYNVITIQSLFFIVYSF